VKNVELLLPCCHVAVLPRVVCLFECGGLFLHIFSHGTVAVLPCCRVAVLPCCRVLFVSLSVGGCFYTSLLTVLLPCCRVAVLPCCHPRFKPFTVGYFVFIFCYKTFNLQLATWQLATWQHSMGYMVCICIILYIMYMATKMATNKKKERK
jgi:hypothetical protein